MNSTIYKCFHQMHDRPRIFEHDATRIFQVDRSLNGVVGKLQEAEFSRLPYNSFVSSGNGNHHLVRKPYPLVGPSML